MNNTLMKNRPKIKQSLPARYNCGPVKLSGDSNAFYERHVAFDHVVAESETTDRDKFEAIARSVRDMLSQRWLKTEETYRQRNAKRVYYLSMEFLLSRALANNISNLLIVPEAQQFAKHHQLDPLQIIEQEPDAGFGNGGLGRLAACFLDSMATLGLAGMGYGLRYDYGIFRQSIRNGWQAEQPDHWLARPDPGESRLADGGRSRFFGGYGKWRSIECAAARHRSRSPPAPVGTVAIIRPVHAKFAARAFAPPGIAWRRGFGSHVAIRPPARHGTTVPIGRIRTWCRARW